MSNAGGGWICPGGAAPHAAELEQVERLPNHGRDAMAIERCRGCGTLFLHRAFEVSDWGPNGDYYSETRIWTPLGPDEVEILRADRRYRPRAEAAHRRDSPWRAG